MNTSAVAAIITATVSVVAFYLARRVGRIVTAPMTESETYDFVGASAISALLSILIVFICALMVAAIIENNVPVVIILTVLFLAVVRFLWSTARESYIIARNAHRRA